VVCDDESIGAEARLSNSGFGLLAAMLEVYRFAALSTPSISDAHQILVRASLCVRQDI
jgi:hypothetical protein